MHFVHYDELSRKVGPTAISTPGFVEKISRKVMDTDKVACKNTFQVWCYSKHSSLFCSKSVELENNAKGSRSQNSG